MTLLTSADATFAQAAETTLAIPFRPLASDATKLDPASVPQNFNADLADLLWQIKRAGVSLTGKIAEYAGFYVDGTDIKWDSNTDNGNQPDDNSSPAPTNKQRNKSLDKLTFLIMFILPFQKDALNAHYGDPLNGPTTTWSYQANQLRVTPLKKLNARGEQVNASNIHCDNAGIPLGAEYDTPTAFKHYGFDAAAVGNIGIAAKTRPLYVFLTFSTEAALTDDLAATANTRSVTQQPENIIGVQAKGFPASTFKERVVHSGTYAGLTPFATFLPHFPTNPTDFEQQIIQQEAATNRYYVVSSKNPADKLYLELLPLDEDLSDEIFELNGLKIKKAHPTNTSWFIAGYFTLPYKQGDVTWSSTFGFDNGLPGLRGGVQFEKIAIAEHSGMTLGWGFDMGARSYPQHYYNINFQILIYDNHATQTPAATDFVLWYRGMRVSDPMSFTVSTSSAAAVKTALLKLLELNEKAWNDSHQVPKNPDTIVVTPITNSGVPEYSKGYDVTIRRVNMETAIDGFYNMYAGNVFYHKETEAKANVKLLPALEKDRFVINSDALDTDGNHRQWMAFTSLMNAFFGGQTWTDLTHFEGLTPGHEEEERDRFVELMKRSIGVRRGPAFVLTRNNRSLLRKFRLPLVADLYPPFVTLFVLPNYYDVIYANVPSNLKSRLNVAEKYVLLSRAYQGKTGSQPLVNRAVKTKSIDALIDAVAAFNSSSTQAPRKAAITKTLNEHFRRELYRNVEYP